MAIRVVLVTDHTTSSCQLVKLQQPRTSHANKLPHDIIKSFIGQP